MSTRVTSAERELRLRVSDLETALKHVAKIAADNSITPKARLQRISGICSLYSVSQMDGATDGHSFARAAAERDKAVPSE
jgi:hypothetical protein